MGIRGCPSRRGRRIDPAEMPVGAAVDDIDAAMGGVPEHQNRGAGHVELGHRVADRELLQAGGRLGNDDRREAVDFGLALRLGRGDDIACGIDRGPVVEALGAMLFEPAMIAAQPFLDPQRRLVGAGIGVGRHAFGVQRDLGIEMNGAFGAEAEAVPRQGQVPGIAAVEILGHGLGDAVADAVAQGRADVEVLSGNAKCHASLRYSTIPASLELCIGTGGVNACRVEHRMAPRNDEQAHPAAALCFSRRRCTDDGMRIASRYLATVRRAMSMPASRSLSTMVSSERTSLDGSASINCLMRWRTASAECASPPWAAAIAEVKKYLSSKMPRLVAMYLLAVTRDTVDSCMPMASATVFKFSGRRCSTPRAKNASCWRTISLETFRMVRARWSSARTSQVALCRHSAR